jgi:hypothetical protein
MKKIFIVLVVLLISATNFAQTTELTNSLKTLKKNLQDYAVYSPSPQDLTRFKAKAFDSCSIKYYYISNESNQETMVEFQPILSNTGTFNRSNDPNKNTVFVRDKSGNGTVERNDALKRTNEVNNNSQPVTDISKDIKTFNFSYVLPDSIIINPEQTKNRYSLTFSIKETTPDYKIEEKYTIFLKAKNQETLDEVLKNFKQVVSICKTN